MANLKYKVWTWWIELPFEGLMVEIYGNKMFVIDSAVGQTNHSDKNAVIFFHGFPWWDIFLIYQLSVNINNKVAQKGYKNPLKKLRNNFLTNTYTEVRITSFIRLANSLSGTSEMDGKGGQLPTQVLANLLTLSKPEGADFAPKLLLAHPVLGSFLRHCLFPLLNPSDKKLVNTTSAQCWGSIWLATGARTDTSTLQFLADPTRGVDYAHHTTTAPLLDFWTFHRLC